MSGKSNQKKKVPRKESHTSDNNFGSNKITSRQKFDFNNLNRNIGEKQEKYLSLSTGTETEHDPYNNINKLISQHNLGDLAFSESPLNHSNIDTIPKNERSTNLEKFHKSFQNSHNISMYNSTKIEEENSQSDSFSLDVIKQNNSKNKFTHNLDGQLNSLMEWHSNRYHNLIKNNKTPSKIHFNNTLANMFSVAYYLPDNLENFINESFILKYERAIIQFLQHAHLLNKCSSSIGSEINTSNNTSIISSSSIITPSYSVSVNENNENRRYNQPINSYFIHSTNDNSSHFTFQNIKVSNSTSLLGSHNSFSVPLHNYKVLYSPSSQQFTNINTSSDQNKILHGTGNLTLHSETSNSHSYISKVSSHPSITRIPNPPNSQNFSKKNMKQYNNSR